ncbi:MAG: hypothetical protein ACKVPJ_02380 [Chitinophagales bacterium]
MKNLTSFLSISILFISCSSYMSPYTERVQNDAQLTIEELKQIQFYLSHTIVLYRDAGSAEKEIEDGELKVKKGQQIEEIVIEAGTPGVVVARDDKGNLLVSFDSEGNVLRFGVNHNSNGKYTLMAKDWAGHTGIVMYGNQEYKTSPQSSYAYLMLNMKQVNNTTIESREAAGRTLGP